MHRGSMRVNQQFWTFMMVPGDVEIGDPICRKRRKELVRRITVIDAVDIKIIDVEQQIAICGFEHGCEELGLGYSCSSVA